MNWNHIGIILTCLGGWILSVEIIPKKLYKNIGEKSKRLVDRIEDKLLFNRLYQDDYGNLLILLILLFIVSYFLTNNIFDFIGTEFAEENAKNRKIIEPLIFTLLIFYSPHIIAYLILIPVIVWEVFKFIILFSIRKKKLRDFSLKHITSKDDLKETLYFLIFPLLLIPFLIPKIIEFSLFIFLFVMEPVTWVTSTISTKTIRIIVGTLQIIIGAYLQIKFSI